MPESESCFALRVWRLRVRIGARQLQRAIHRFGTAIGKENAVEPGPFGQFARERRLIRIVKEIRKVNGAPGFAPDHAHQARMRVAERIDGDSAEKIQIFASPRIIEAAAAPVREHHGRPPVRIHQVARFVAADLRRRRSTFFCCTFLFAIFQHAAPCAAFAAG